MQPVDWRKVQCGGMPELLKALQELEGELLKLEAEMAARERMGAWWFGRYAELYLHLVQAGMPAQLEGAEIGAWLQRRTGSGGTGVSGYDERTGSGTGCRDGDGITN